MSRVYAKRTDSNQKEIVAALRKAGAVVIILAGALDLLVYKNGLLFALECKKDGKAKLTTEQARIFALVPSDGPIRRVESVSQALEMIGAIY